MGCSKNIVLKVENELATILQLHAKIRIATNSIYDNNLPFSFAGRFGNKLSIQHKGSPYLQLNLLSQPNHNLNLIQLNCS